MSEALRGLFLIAGSLLLADVSLFGPGLIIPGLGISLRRALFVLLLLTGAARRMARRQPYTLDELSLLSLGALLSMLWVVVLPLSYGFSASLALADASPWRGLLLLDVWPWDAWPEPAQWRRFSNYVLGLAIVLALLHILIWALIVSDILQPELLAVVSNLIAPSEDPSDSFIIVSLLDGGQYRVFWSSSIVLLGSMYFLWTRLTSTHSRGTLIALVFAGFALWATHIRAFLGALLIFLSLDFGLRLSRRSANLPVLRVIGFWMAAVLAVSLAIDPTLLSSLGLSRDVSDVERVAQARALIAQFLAHPLLGTGFGSYTLQVIRSEISPFAYELTFYGLIMKLGVLGIAALLLYVCVALRLVRLPILACTDPAGYRTWVAFTTGFWFSGATNPMVTNFAGMTVLVLLMVDARHRTSFA